MLTPSLGRLRGLSCVLLGVTLAALARAAADPGSGLFAPDRLKTVELNGVRVRLGEPVAITSQISWGTEWLHQDSKPKMSFAHFFPSIDRFPNGELIATYAMDPDDTGPVVLAGLQVSNDGGAHWGTRYAGIMQHNPMICLPEPDDSLLAIASEMMQLTPGDERNFIGPTYLYQHGGERIVITPKGVRVVDWPWPVDVFPAPRPRDTWHTKFCFTGSVVPSGARLLITGYGLRKGETLYQTVLLASTDGGATWRYYSTIAAGEPALASEPHYEGPNESNLLRLADGDLMAVFRVGSGRHWQIRRCYSHDEGRTWTKPDALPAYSVLPHVVRTANGLIVLTTGRPGIDLWLATDARATHWQRVDVIAHHNTRESDATYRITSTGSGDTLRWQTTSYTAMTEVAPNRLLLIYERDAVIRPPERAPTSLDDLSRVFVLPIELERN